MAFNRPTLRALVTQSESEINALIVGADARLRFSVLNVFARVWAGLVDGLYSALTFLSKQLFVMTATRQFLTLIGQSYGLPRNTASASAGQVRINGVDGTIVNINTIFSRADGVQYIATTGGTISGGFALVEAVGTTTGLNTNATQDTQLNSATPIAGATSIVVSVGGMTGGADEEGDDSYRARLQFRLENQGGAGTRADWERWARSYSASVTRVWVIPLVQGAGTVGIVFAEDNALIVPSPAQVASMQAYLDEFAPAGSTVYVYEPTLVPIDFSIAETPSGQPTVRQSITEELTDLLFREAYPANTIPLSEINATISSAVGETDHILTVPSSSLTFDATAPNFEVGVMGTITWL